MKQLLLHSRQEAKVPTLLLRLRAPMMSWGDHSRFTIRDSRTEPTKSAVVGLLCAALGRPRWETVQDLAALRMGVRVNKEGVMQQDYHTVMDSLDAKNANTLPSHRYYIADSDYLVGLEGDQALLNTLDLALANPCWQLYLGRKSFIPSCPVRLGVVADSLIEALKNHPYAKPSKNPPERLRYVLEVPNSLDIRRDVPIDWEKRVFGSRCVETTFREVS